MGWGRAAAALQARMTDLRMKQFDLATRSGVSPATIREILHGKPRDRNPRTMAALSEAVGWPADRLSALVEGTTGTDGPETADPDTGSDEEIGAELLAIKRELERINRRLDALESGTAEGEQ